MNENKLVIGVLEGMGSYVMVDFYRRFVDAFPTEKNWQKSRILIDSYASIPSRVRALLFGERTEELLECMTSSVRGLLHAGADRIIIACNTAHAFLPELYRRVPKAEGYILNLITLCAGECGRRGYRHVHLFASEGTIQSGIYEKAFEESGVQIERTNNSEMGDIRKLMEDVKQNYICDVSIRRFARLLSRHNCPVILGCTELPVLYERSRNIRESTDRIIDLLQIAINVMTNERFSCSGFTLDGQGEVDVIA